MTRRSLLVAAACLAAAGGAGGAGGASAQVDTTRRDTTARDTTPALLPAFAPSLAEGPLPRGARYSFPTDSLVFSNVATLSDLLSHIPGVYVARGGFYGQPEIVLYGGRGPAALEVYWDGTPYLPIGRDSVYLDPARIPLAPLERVDVLVLPATLRVYLVTRRQRSAVPASEVRILTGDANHTGYRGAFAKRWRSGVGLSLVGDWNTLNGYTSSATTKFTGVDLWFQAEYVPSPHLGGSYQILSSTWSRDAGPITDELRFKRRDNILRFFLARRTDGLGPRLELTYARAAASRDTAVARRTLSQGIVELSDTWRRGHASVALRVQDEHRPFQVEARLAWSPVRRIALAADARQAVYELSGRGFRMHVSGGIEFPLGFSAQGDVAWARDFQAPALATDSLERTVDAAAALRWQQRWLTLEVGGARRDAFEPIGRPGGLKSVGSLGPSPRADYVTVSAGIRPLPGLFLSGWYFNPLNRRHADFEPPYHARLSLTFYSKFWRVYKSGVFALRGEAALESWSGGIGGRDTSGAGLVLPGASFAETNVELQLAGVTIFWFIRNVNLMRAGYVPGLDYPRRVQFYGVRWVFAN